MASGKGHNLKRFLMLLWTGRDIGVSAALEHPTKATTDALPDNNLPDFLVDAGISADSISRAEPTYPTPIDTSPEEIKQNTIIEESQIPVTEITNKKIEPETTTKKIISEKKEQKPVVSKKIKTPTEETDQGEKITIDISRDGMDVIELDTETTKRHTLVIGMTGSGKTTLLEKMILQDIDSGRGVGLIDPHGDLYEKILRQIPKSRSNDVVLFDLTDVEYPIGFNILENTYDQFPSLVASSIVGVFKKIFGYSWGPRLEYVLRNATLTLLENPGNTLLDLTLLLTDEGFRKKFLQKIHNPFLQKFWSDEFDNLSSSKQAEVVSPILNKVGQFISVPLIRNIVSQPQSGFSPRWIMDNKKIFLANLSKGKIGEDVSNMFGSMLVSKFQLDVMSRANIAPSDRHQYTLYVDEFQNFATESFADIFSESRKYGLWLVIAHQYLGQVHPPLVEAILGNVGTIIAFHIGSQDARILAPNIHQSIQPQDLSEQSLYEFTLKTTRKNKKEILHGELLDPTMTIHRSGLQNSDTLKALVRDKFAKKRDFVEGKLNIKMNDSSEQESHKKGVKYFSGNQQPEL